MSTVIITGGNGFVGKHLVNELRHEWPEATLVIWDKKLDGLPDGVQGKEVDITKPESYRLELKTRQPEWIAHLAAIAPIPAAMKDPELTKRVNVDATRELLQAVREESNQTGVLAISSSDIYGSTSLTTSGSTSLTLRPAQSFDKTTTSGSTRYGAGQKEQDTPLPELPLKEAKPTNPYAASKWQMEEIIEKDYNDIVIRARPFPHIGPGQGKGFVTADFAAQIAAAERGEQEPIIQVGNLDTRRDFTDVRDVVKAYRLLMEKGRMGEVYHVASGKAVRIKEVLERLLALTKVKMEIVQDQQKMRKADIKGLIGSADKLHEATGWEPKIELQQSLEDVLQWWRGNGR